jgi:hypothetical protein
MSTVEAAVAESTPAPPALVRREIFCSGAEPELFHSIVRPQQVWTRDPFDVEDIHREARETFQRLLHRAGASPPLPYGRLLLLKGEAGSGKTHLMRAFRNYVHADWQGYCGYMEMTSLVDNYAYYTLSNLISALDQPYSAPDIQTSGLMLLSNGLFEALAEVTPEQRAELREGPADDLAGRVEAYADLAQRDPRFRACDLDLLRAMLYLQRDDPRVKSLTMRWLRCEDLAERDRAVLSLLVPRTRAEDPLRMITELGRLIGAVHQLPLVVCADQLEGSLDMDPDEKQSGLRFRKMIDTLTSIAERVPSSVVVISCLEDYYAHFAKHLPKPKLDRLEKEITPVRLTGQRTAEEVESLIAHRLQYLYEENGIPADEENPTFPFTAATLRNLAGLGTRDVLAHCHHHREACVAAGRWLEPNWSATPSPTPAPADDPLQRQWNDFRSAFSDPVPDGEEALAGLLAWAVGQCSQEMPADFWFAADKHNLHGRMLAVEVHQPQNAVGRLLVAVCNKAAKGVGLANQITEAEKVASEIPVVLVRSTDFPRNPKGVVSQQIGKLVSRGGRRVVVRDTDWRAMLALQAFQRQHGKDPQFAAWVKESQPLINITSLREILAMNQLLRPRPAEVEPVRPSAPPPKSVPRTQPEQVVPPEVPLDLGTKSGLVPGQVRVSLKELLQHMAFLGGSGSGKTTAALTLIEQLLERNIPVVLLDRKGDLCSYANPDAWEKVLPDQEWSKRRQRLRERLDVTVYTPGQPEGRPLLIPIVPDGFGELPEFDREQIAGVAATGLAGMMGYNLRGAGTDRQRLSILRKAIELLGSLPGQAVTVAALRKLIEERDDALLNAVGGFEDRQYKKLADDLLTLSHNHKKLLEGEGEKLDIDALLGRGPHARPGKTRLSVISTRFLGDQATVDFWVSQLLMALGRWTGAAATDHLQAVFLFDEADLYLPATRQPATKAPMENLLRRARSAGLGLMLATQSPGDFDYKCRDNIRAWLVGRVREKVALDKLKPMFADGKVDMAARLPAQETGEFHLLREKEICALKTFPSLIVADQVPEERILELARRTS